MNYYINFTGGSYGHFLEYVLNRYVFKIDYGKTTEHSLFDMFGASHVRDSVYLANRKIIATHLDFSDRYLCDYDLKNEDIVVAITVSFDDRYELLYNENLRAGSVDVDFYDLEINTINKLSHPDVKWKWENFINFLVNQYGARRNYSRQLLRDVFFSSLLDPTMRLNNLINVKYKKEPNLKISMSSFHNFVDFYKNIKKLAEVLNPDTNIDMLELYTMWEIFDSKNIAKKSKQRCDEILEAIKLNKSLAFQCNIVEEAWINCNITEIYNINRELDCFNDTYPTNTLHIRNQIDKYLSMLYRKP
jgi:hypothetical protein